MQITSNGVTSEIQKISKQATAWHGNNNSHGDYKLTSSRILYKQNRKDNYFAGIPSKPKTIFNRKNLAVLAEPIA